MPVDLHDDDDGSERGHGHNRRFDDFDCPTCSANNPYDDAFGDGEEVLCYYCGQGFRAQVDSEGRLRLREV
jgi:hypothetical protein